MKLERFSVEKTLNRGLKDRGGGGLGLRSGQREGMK